MFSQSLILPALQVSMTCAAEMGCSDSIIKFVMPLGATINMSGTALYEATTVIFIAQVGCFLAEKFCSVALMLARLCSTVAKDLSEKVIVLCNSCLM